MSNPLRVLVENPDEILNAGLYGAGAIIRIQSSATEAGAYSDLSGTGSTPTIAVLVTARSYVGYDPNGISSTWYRTRYENSGATRLSDWTAVFQAGDETGGLLCSLYDVRQRLNITDTDSDEDLLEFIGQVSTGINGYCGRLFNRTPLSGSTTFLFDIRQSCRTLWVPQGIAVLTQLEIATQTGGTFTVVPTTDWFLDPPETERDYGWPATRITLSDQGTAPRFYPGKRVVRGTGARGWEKVPPDIQGIALTAVIRRWQARASGQAELIGSTDFGTRVLRWISPEELGTLDLYRHMAVG